MERRDINPWVHIWTEPRKTMRSILNNNPNRAIIILAIVAGALSAFSLLLMHWPSFKEIGQHPAILIITLIIGAVLGLVLLHFMGWLLTLTGSWLGGKGSYTDVKSAVGWGNYPNIIGQLLGILRIFSLSNFWLQLILGIITFAYGIWTFIISLKLIGEAHQFSAWKSLLALVIAFVLLFVAIMIVALLVPLLKPLFQ